MRTYIFLLFLLVLKTVHASDPYPRNESIDIRHYQFKLELNDSTNRIAGETVIDIRFKNSLEGFAISTMFVNAVTFDGGKTWTRADETDSIEFPEHDGYYKAIDGSSELYLIGTDGYVVKWK